MSARLAPVLTKEMTGEVVEAVAGSVVAVVAVEVVVVVEEGEGIRPLAKIIPHM